MWDKKEKEGQSRMERRRKGSEGWRGGERVVQDEEEKEG